jgi:DNA repair exonuclease SbcCD ATPase subunit
MFDGMIRIATKIETKDFDAQIKYLEQKANEIEKVLESDLKVPVELRLDEQSRLKLKSDLQTTKNQIISLQEQANKGVEIKQKGTNDFEKMTKSAKRFALSLISIRGAYTLLSRASSAYMQTDENATKQMESNWIGLGTILAPAIELIVGLFKKAVTSILYFMSVLTGANYIEKANTAILKKQTEATKELTKANNKLNASFDEMNVLQEPSSSSADSGVDTTPLFDISDIGENARKTIEKIGTALQPVYEKIKDIIKWALDNPEAILGILGGATLLSMLGKIIGVAGAGTAVGTGLAGVLGALLAIASIGIITVTIKTVYKSVEEAKKATKNANDAVKNYKKSSEELTKAIEDLTRSQEISNEQIKIANERFKNCTDSSLDLAESYKDQLNKLNPLEALVYSITGDYKSLADATKTYIDDAYDQIKAWEKLYDQGLLNEEQTEDYKNALSRFKDMVGKSAENIDKLSNNFNMNEQDAKNLMKQYQDITEQLEEVSSSTKNSKDKITDLSKEIKNLPDSKTIKIDADTSKAKSGLGGLLSTIASKVSSIFGINFSFPKLATGGIINNPGRGVPLGGAIGGEVSKEGVVPLTDSQAMEELGRTIGKYITINANIVNTMNGRTISRELQRISNNDDFASNS